MSKPHLISSISLNGSFLQRECENVCPVHHLIPCFRERCPGCCMLVQSSQRLGETSASNTSVQVVNSKGHRVNLRPQMQPWISRKLGVRPLQFCSVRPVEVPSVTHRRTGFQKLPGSSVWGCCRPGASVVDIPLNWTLALLYTWNEVNNPWNRCRLEGWCRERVSHHASCADIPSFESKCCPEPDSEECIWSPVPPKPACLTQSNRENCFYLSSA